MAATVAAVTAVAVEPAKSVARPHQILSRETSFISKAVSTEEKEEAAVIPPAVTTVQVSAAPQITVPAVTTSGTVASTITITSKF